jgi:hypoxanthine phosphoribosyltransferase
METEADRIDVIFTPERIAQRIEALAGQIAAAKVEPLLVVAILKGSFVFAADLIRALHRAGLKPEVDFITLSSYRKSTRSSGAVDILRDLETDVAARGAARIMTCVLLDKGSRRAVNVTADFKAFDCPEVFVVGYGMDVGHRYRELPFVGQVVHR